MPEPGGVSGQGCHWHTQFLANQLFDHMIFSQYFEANFLMGNKIKIFGVQTPISSTLFRDQTLEIYSGHIRGKLQNHNYSNSPR